MKSRLILLAISLCTLTAFALPSTKKDNAKTAVEKLWKDHDKAASDDRPQKVLSILDEIRTKSLPAKLPWDYYRACKGISMVTGRINWKDASSAQALLKERIAEYDLPVMSFQYLSDFSYYGNDPLEFVRNNASALRKANDDSFRSKAYSNSRSLTGLMIESARNDLEYALWLLKERGCDCNELLRKEVSGRYPEAAVLEFISSREISDSSLRRKAYREGAEHYTGKAASMLFSGELLCEQFQDYSRDDKTSSQQYRKLQSSCKEYIRLLKTFSSTEGPLSEQCTSVERLLERLEEANAWLKIKDGVLKAGFRNVDKISVEFSSKDPLSSSFKTTIENPAKSFYKKDEVSLTLPPLNDATYIVKYKFLGEQRELTYSKTSLSIALREGSDGQYVYVADYNSGKPLDKADFTLYSRKNDAEQASAKGLSLNGFTKLPLPKIKSGYLRCSYTGSDGIFHRSADIDLSDRQEVAHAKERFKGEIFTDRGEYAPGDTLRFKVIAYSSKACLKKGETLLAGLCDAKGDKLQSISLSTNEFGSASGEFVLPRDRRNGRWNIFVEYDGKTIGGNDFRVGDFALPSFSISYRKMDYLVLVGDTLTVKGCAKALSGHPIAGAKVQFTIRCSYPSQVQVIEGTTASDGSFEVPVIVSNPSAYHVDTRVTAPSGESEELSLGFYGRSSIPGYLVIENAEDASVGNVIAGGKLKVKYSVDNALCKGLRGDINISYKIFHGDRLADSGNLKPNITSEIDLEKLPSGTYEILCEASLRKADGYLATGSDKDTFYKVSDSDTAFQSRIESLFRAVHSGDGVCLQSAAGEGPIWACVEIFGENLQRLRSEQLYLESGAMKMLSYGYPSSWPDEVSLNVFYFKGSERHCYSTTFSRPKPSKQDFSLNISRLTSLAYPSSRVELSLKAPLGSECLVSVYDKATEAIAKAYWHPLERHEDLGRKAYYDSRCGRNESLEDRSYASGNKMLMSKAAAFDAVTYDSLANEEEAIPMQLREDIGNITVREHFAKTLAFEPFLKPDSNGEVSLSFPSGDALSTFVVRCFAHNKELESAFENGEFKVSLPVKVSLAEPGLLYEGDRYTLKATLSSLSEEPISGAMVLELYDTGNYKDVLPRSVTIKRLSLEALASFTAEFPLTVPGCSELGLKVSFIPDKGKYSDAIFVKIPVRKPVQTLSETHSAVLLSGENADSLVRSLREQFVNMPGTQAEVSQRSILQMIQDALPREIEPSADDVLSLSSAYYARALSNLEEDEQLRERIFRCQNADGGFGWFEGMSSSAIITAIVLSRISDTKAVEYLDKHYKELSLEQYLYIRSKYSDIPFEQNIDRAFRRQVRNVLTPSKERGMSGQILRKARRILTLRNLQGSPLARKWGLRNTRKMEKSLNADLASLKEYAVTHQSGGTYFPNAVMPFRGLLESELYAHSLLAGLMREEGEVSLSDDICIWIMVQKETQQWSSDPSYIEAIAEVLKASQKVKDTKVIALTASSELPFEDIKPSGNGMRISLKYLREDGTSLKEGDTLSVGEKISAVCSLWSEENRSFVRVSLPRAGCLLPVNQLSGTNGWWMRRSYRNVKVDQIEYFYDIFPEEEYELREEYFVRSSGRFSAPAPVVECLYCPHYRANAEAAVLQAQ